MANNKLINRSLIITAGLVVIYFIFFLANLSAVEKNEIIIANKASNSLDGKFVKYGIPINRYEIKSDVVKRSDFFASIFSKYIPYNSVIKLVENTKEIFSPKKLVYNKKYSVFTKNNKAKYLVYEQNHVDFIVYDLENLSAYKGSKSVDKVFKTVGGRINSSLWNTLTEIKSNPMLAVELSDVFAWTVDFFGIQKGDSFKVMYEESMVDGKSTGHIDIKGACLNHLGENHYAFYYNKDSQKPGYYDEKGKSLQKQFLKAPLRYSRISSHFSNKRFHPVLKYYRAHHGIDYAAPIGTPVFSIGDGVITRRRYQKRGAGRYLRIKHNSVYSTAYMHLRSFAKGMFVGKKVKQGQLIGFVGSSGLSTGPHLDFRVYKNNKAINPLRLKSPAATPIKQDFLKEYITSSNQLKSKIDSIKILN